MKWCSRRLTRDMKVRFVRVDEGTAASILPAVTSDLPGPMCESSPRLSRPMASTSSLAPQRAESVYGCWRLSKTTLSTLCAPCSLPGLTFGRRLHKPTAAFQAHTGAAYSVCFTEGGATLVRCLSTPLDANANMVVVCQWGRRRSKSLGLEHGHRLSR